MIYDGPAATPSAPAQGNGPNNPPSPPTPGPAAEGAPTPMTGEIYNSLNGSQTALLNVNVPAEAKVFVNGTATTSSGSDRQFVSRGLTAGNSYTYEVRAEYMKDGKTVDETKTVTLGPGQMVNLAFSFDGDKSPVASKAKTKLTLHVPADAKVYLSGHETTSTGDVREFTTSKLDNGAEWKDYTVKVVSNVDGREESKEQTITLTGGEDRDLSFDFNSNPVAQTAAVTR